MTKPRTLADVLREIRDLKERAAVNAALANYLRTYYLPRDAGQAQKRLACENAPVSERMLDEIACELEEGAQEMNKAAQAALTEQYDG